MDLSLPLAIGLLVALKVRPHIRVQGDLAMRLLVALCLVLLVVASPALGADPRDPFVTVAQRNLAGARIADPPVNTGGRSPVGPQMYRRIVDSVVLVITQEAFGSGVIVSPEGHILTNWHVVQGTETVAVVRRSQDLLRGMQAIRREHVYVARVLALDVRRDLALIVLTPPPAGLRVAPLGEGGSVEVGQDVYAVGHPKELLWSYTEGVVSQIRPQYEWTYQEGSTHQATIIQTQAPMHQGSSGGALFDGQGRVVGITTAMKDPTLGMAVAVSEVRDWISSLTRR